jgi:hypothetical protein
MYNNELQNRHFAGLKEKYKVGQYESAEFNSFLYMILRKADLGIKITSLEFQWLIENHFSETVKIIRLQEYQAEDRKRLEDELLQLRIKYRIPKDLYLSISSPVYAILGKLDAGYNLANEELEFINNQGFKDAITLIQEI